MEKHSVTRVIACLLLPCLVLAQESNNVSKTGTVAAPFLEIPVGASAIGMGTAFVSIANDVTALYWNVAGIAAMQQNEAAAIHTNWIANTKFDFAGVVIPIGGVGTIGVSVTSLGMDDMMVRTVEKPDGTGEYFSAGDLAVGLSYARQLSDRFAIGFTAKYIQQNIWHETAYAFAVDVGTAFRTDLIGGLVIGASVSNFGTSMKMSGRDTRTFARVDPTKLGSNEQVPYNVELEAWDLPLLFQFGLSTNVLKTDDYRVTVAVDALHPSDNYESVNIGTEFAFQDFLYVRGGLHSLFLDAAEGMYSFGVGVASSSLFGSTNIRFDYAFRDMGRLQNIHVFSLGVRF
jgi:hypothetical protein